MLIVIWIFDSYDMENEVLPPGLARQLRVPACHYKTL
jgi:hypothetical protein